MKRFLIFLRSDGHCALLQILAKSAREAFLQYLVEEAGARVANSTITMDDGYKGLITYNHPLEAIESEYKSLDGQYGQSWEICCLDDRSLAKPFEELYCSWDPNEVSTHIANARKTFRKDHPKSNARAFIWYLEGGVLVTFQRRKNPRRPWPIEILGRYFMPWRGSWEFVRFEGDLDEIMDRMAIDIPVRKTEKLGE